MKTIPLAVLLFVAAVVSAPALDKVRISATRKTASSEQGSTQQLPKTTIRATRQDVYYRFGFQRMVPSVPEKLEVQWVIVIERMGGRLVPAVTGSTELEMPLGREVEVSTDPVPLLGRAWEGGSRSIEDSIYGYAVRVTDPDGNIVAEKFNPKALESQIDGIVEQGDKDRDAIQDLRKLFPRLPFGRRP